MAQPESNSKPSFRWIWLLAVLVVVGIAYTLFHKRNSSLRDSAPGLDSTGMAADTANAGSQGLAANGPDWKKVDFKSPAAADKGVSDKDIRISGNKDYTIYTLKENLLFVTDQSRLQETAVAKLEQVASAINKRYKAPSIAVFGGADSIADTKGQNKQLGIERAIAIKDWLLKNGRFAADEVTIQSRRQADPVVGQGKSPKSPATQEVVIVAYRKDAKGMSR